MLELRRFHAWSLRLVVLSLLLFGAVSAQAQQSLPAPLAPTVPASNNTGTYTVSYSPGPGAMATLLQERAGTSGNWVQLSSGAPYIVQLNNKPDGTYYYRAVSLLPTYYGGPPYYVYGPLSSVVVSAGPPPPQDLMSNQLGYTYEARVGDINADGRQDVFVRRTAGGLPGNGALGEVILRALGDGTFSQGTLNSAQLATAANWPILNTRIELSDFNLDGYVDVLLRELGSAIGGALGQIIVSSGQIRALAPQRVIPMNAKFNRFMNDVGSWIQNPNYFVANAPLILIDIWILEYRCPYDVIYGEYVACEYYEVWGGYQIIQDFSAFDSDAVSFSRLFNQVINGILKPMVIPGSGDARGIDALFRSVFGVPVMRGIFGNNCYDYPYDPITHLPCFDYNALGAALLSNLFKSKTNFGNARNLTPGEKVEAATLGLPIRGVNEVLLYNLTVPLLSDYFGVPWVSPNGHIYVGSDWRDDYAAVPIVARSNRSEGVLLATLLHELTHVYQVRNQGYNAFTMVVAHREAMQGRGYNYTPLDFSVSFWSLNIEQQAEIMGDLYLARYGHSAHLGENRQNAPLLSQLQQYVPQFPR